MIYIHMYADITLFYDIFIWMQILRTVNTDREISYVSMLGLFCSSPLLFEVNSDQFLIFYESA